MNFQQVHEFSAKMSACTEHRNMYAVIDRSDVVTIMNTLNMDGAEEKCMELYDRNDNLRINWEVFSWVFSNLS